MKAQVQGGDNLIDNDSSQAALQKRVFERWERMILTEQDIRCVSFSFRITHPN
jgi:hypothetical protein